MQTSIASRARLTPHIFVRQDKWPLRLRSATAVTVLSLVGLLVGTGLLLAARRLAGALSVQLPWDAMLFVAMVTILLVTAARTAWRQAFPLSDEEKADLTWREAVVGWGPSLALVLVAIGCSYPGYRTGDWLIWMPLVVADQFLRQAFSRTDHSHLKLAEPYELPAIPAQLPSAEVLQRLYRVRDDEGREAIYGTLRADFESGQRTAVLHVGFCPPLEYLPQIEASSLPDSAASLKVVQAFAHGARIDVRLPETPAAACQVWIDMAAKPSE